MRCAERAVGEGQTEKLGLKDLNALPSAASLHRVNLLATGFSVSIGYRCRNIICAETPLFLGCLVLLREDIVVTAQGRDFL